MSLCFGFVGLPNAGKSTLFNALTTLSVPNDNFAFCTIEPNHGTVMRPDPRLAQLQRLSSAKKIIPAAVDCVDIAGLVEGAAQGEGLGNKFLHHIRSVDAIIQVVRCFAEESVVHVSGTVDPIRDLEIVRTELILADCESIERISERLKRGKRREESEKDQQILLEWKKLLEQGIGLNSCMKEEWTPLLQKYPLLSAKPTLYLANIGDQGGDTSLLTQLQNYLNRENAVWLALNVPQAWELSKLSEEEQAEMLSLLGEETPPVVTLIQAAFNLLGLATYFTVGEKEVRAWPFQQGSSAPQAAGVIHSDFQKGFIRAEIISYDDFIAFNGEQGAKKAGKMRLEGKEYIMKDGDVAHFRFNI